MSQLTAAVAELKEAVTQVIADKPFSISDRRLILSVAAITPAADADKQAVAQAARQVAVDIVTDFGADLADFLERCVAKTNEDVEEVASRIERIKCQT